MLSNAETKDGGDTPENAVEAFLQDLKVAGKDTNSVRDVYAKHCLVPNIYDLSISNRMQPQGIESAPLSKTLLTVLIDWKKNTSTSFPTDYQNVSVFLYEASVEISIQHPHKNKPEFSGSTNSQSSQKINQVWVVAAYFNTASHSWKIWNWTREKIETFSNIRSSKSVSNAIPNLIQMDRLMFLGKLFAAKEIAAQRSESNQFYLTDVIQDIIGENTLAEKNESNPTVNNTNKETPASEPVQPVNEKTASSDASEKLYVERSFATPPFENTKIGLTPDQMDEMATLLGNQTRRVAPQNSKDYDLASKAIALALALSPENKAANIAAILYSKGTEFKTSDKALKPEEFSSKISSFCDALIKSAQSDSMKLAALLIDIALDSGNSSEDILYSASQLKNKGFVADWNAFACKGSSLIGSSVSIESIKQSKIHGLVVQNLGNGKYAGFAMEIITTPVVAKSTKSTGARFTNKVGKMMSDSLEQSVRAIKSKTQWPANLAFEFSFDNQYQLKDGPSAATAYAVNMLSSITGFEIDEKVAITGDLSADCVVRPVGGVASKARGARKANCSIIGIPSSTSWEIEDDIVLSESFESVWKSQIFILSKLDDAVAIAKKEKPENIAKAIALFSTVSDKVIAANAFDKSIDTKTEKALLDVLALAPNHLSADILIRCKNRSLKTSLSVKSSAVLILNAAKPIFEYIDNYNTSRTTQSASFFENIEREIDQIGPKIDSSMTSLLDDLKRMVLECREFDRSSKSSQAVSAFNQSISKYRSELDKIFSDPKFIEQINE